MCVYAHVQTATETRNGCKSCWSHSYRQLVMSCLTWVSGRRAVCVPNHWAISLAPENKICKGNLESEKEGVSLLPNGFRSQVARTAVGSQRCSVGRGTWGLDWWWLKFHPHMAGEDWSHKLFPNFHKCSVDMDTLSLKNKCGKKSVAKGGWGVGRVPGFLRNLLIPL